MKMEEEVWEPHFTTPEERTYWYAARQQVIEFLLWQLAHSPWQSELVLRGSLPLKLWLGERGREPGDIDSLVPSAQEDVGWAIFETLSRRLEKQSSLGQVTIIREKAICATLWEYTDLPGQRLIFPWRTTDGWFGTVQMDIALNDPMPSAPIPLRYTMGDGTVLDFLSASPEQALAWKLLWLHTDTIAQGKDLYDAVLLAEAFPLDRALLAATLQTDSNRLPFHRETILAWQVDWVGFVDAYPNLTADVYVHGAVGQWLKRLAQALRPTFDQAEGERL
ncbi:nucleotidyl transferase AbiEii/AbiGii toxin family protein [Armatimonas rosea]|uniref:Nucleotidyl transferase AbiEii/AbiGii toxin family protein n=1 Tax=Armatimonas rosea TaxID=685828 RepID=A0A7W9SMN3_ARMRO|nr:nucleotidyl transferase AbiEii/AbiGii toxin family protein [Armatimonas rosea]MBB6048644.1 hypothetical protein [Armatimonas rosea]